MKKPLLTLQSLGAVIVVLVAIGALVKVMKANEPQKPIQHVDPFRTWEITLLNEEAAAPGKVVQAVKDGRVVGTYTCTAQDQAVAWVYDEGGNHNEISQPETQPIDEKNRHYQLSTDVKGPLVRIVVPRGHSVKPSSLAVTFHRYNQDSKSQVVAKVITLTKFADPIRVLPTPSPSAAKAAESIVTATCTTRPDGYSDVSIVTNPPMLKALRERHEYFSLTELSSSFFPEGPTPPNLFSICDDTDAVKVAVSHYKTVETTVYLTYHNAQVVSVNGLRALRFPTTQEIGSVLDAKATIQKLMPIINQKSAHASSIGELLVRLERLPHQSADGNPTASFASISPSVDSLGLDLLRFRLGDITCGEDLQGHRHLGQPSITTIPELKIGIHISRNVKISSQTYVVPVHHLQAKKPIAPPKAQGLGASPMPATGPSAQATPQVSFGPVGGVSRPRQISVYLPKSTGTTAGGF